MDPAKKRRCGLMQFALDWKRANAPTMESKAAYMAAVKVWDLMPKDQRLQYRITKKEQEIKKREFAQRAKRLAHESRNTKLNWQLEKQKYEEAEKLKKAQREQAIASGVASEQSTSEDEDENFNEYTKLFDDKKLFSRT